MWTQEEDILLTSLVNKYGTKHWKMISESIPGRSGKQVGKGHCRRLGAERQTHEQPQQALAAR